ncbi:MAG: TlpA disulfide reductase family protein [Methylotenera sp.]
MQTIKKIGLVVGILALLALLAFQFNKRMFAPQAAFVTLAGKTIHMSDLKGKVVLVNFWATTCSTCINEMPDLVKTYNAYKGKDFEMIAVAMDYDPPAQVLNFATQKALPFPVMHDGFNDVAIAFRHKGITPTTYIYDKSGFRIFYKVGELDFAKLNQLLDKAVL